jgi:hypothetical protein
METSLRRWCGLEPERSDAGAREGALLAGDLRREGMWSSVGGAAGPMLMSTSRLMPFLSGSGWRSFWPVFGGARYEGSSSGIPYPDTLNCERLREPPTRGNASEVYVVRSGAWQTTLEFSRAPPLLGLFFPSAVAGLVPPIRLSGCGG